MIRRAWAACLACGASIWIAACSLGAAGRTQVGITTIAEVTLVTPQAARSQFHEREDARCRAALPPAEHPFEAWRECMDRSYRLDSAVATLDRTLRAAQAALDAGGADGVRPALPCVARAAREAAEAFREAGISVPQDVTRLLGVNEGVTGGCPE